MRLRPRHHLSVKACVVIRHVAGQDKQAEAEGIRHDRPLVQLLGALRRPQGYNVVRRGHGDGVQEHRARRGLAGRAGRVPIEGPLGPVDGHLALAVQHRDGAVGQQRVVRSVAETGVLKGRLLEDVCMDWLASTALEVSELAEMPRNDASSLRSNPEVSRPRARTIVHLIPLNRWKWIEKEWTLDLCVRLAWLRV